MLHRGNSANSHQLVQVSMLHFYVAQWRESPVLTGLLKTDLCFRCYGLGQASAIPRAPRCKQLVISLQYGKRCKYSTPALPSARLLFCMCKLCCKYVSFKKLFPYPFPLFSFVLLIFTIMFTWRQILPLMSVSSTPKVEHYASWTVIAGDNMQSNQHEGSHDFVCFSNYLYKKFQNKWYIH